MPHNMHSNSSNKFISTGLKTLSAAVVSALLLIPNADAAGLGKLTVLSSLGQPLRAEIELTAVSNDEEGTLVAKLANPDAYQKANIEFNPALLSLQFAIDQRDGRKFVRVTSAQAMNEPFVDLLMELGGNKSRLVREYTLLLDPAGQRQVQPAQIATHAATPARASTTTAAAPPIKNSGYIVVAPTSQTPQTAERSTITNATRIAAASAVAAALSGANSKAANNGANSTVQAPVSPASTEYHVKKGDTLGRVASDNLPAGVSLDQMLVALFRSNASAFSGKNMNRLRAGQILSVPDAHNALSISTSEAKSVVLAQSRDFKNYRNTLAAQVAAAAPNKTVESKQSGGGKITTKIEEQSTPASESKDKLKLSRGTAAAAGAAVGTKAASATAATEEKIAREKAAAEAEARVKQLEKNVSDLQSTLELKNKHLAELQNQASNVKTAASVTAAPATSTTTSAATPAVAAAAVASVPVEPAATAVASIPAEPVAVSASATTGASVPAPVVKPKAVAPRPSESGFIESITENPLLLPVGGVLVALLGGLGLLRYRSNKARQQAFMDSSGAPVTNSGLKGNSLFGSTGGQSVDTKNSIFNSNFVPSVSHLDTNVDPVAEADVYIAYGRDAQAEEILKEALRSQPNRNAIRVKLLEIYANRKDPRSFEILASELYSLTRGEGEDWQQAVALGLNVDPTNPLYGSGKLQDQVIAKADAITAPTQPMDGLDFNSMIAPSRPQVEPIPELVHKASVNLLEPLTTNELGKQGNTIAPIQSDKMNFELEELASETSANQNTVLLSAAHEAGKSMLDTLDFELDNKPVTSPAALAKIEERNSPERGAGAFGGPELSEGGQPSTYEPSHAHIDIPADTKPVVAPPIAASPVKHAEPLAAPLEFNLSEMSLDLDGAVHADIRAVAGTSTHAVTDAASSTADNPEMATKLDLAIAYKEIGDKEGARELLEEVLKGGSAQQVVTAKTLLAKL